MEGGGNERAANFVYPSFSAHNSCYPMYIFCSIFFFIDSLPILAIKYPNPISVLETRIIVNLCIFILIITVNKPSWMLIDASLIAT
jgi:hypothetical protein